MKVAIVCDWLTGTGGAERVVLELHKMLPDAPIYTSQYNSSPRIWYGDEWFSNAKIKTGWLQKLPKSLKKILPVFRAWYFSRLNLSEYDLVISTSGAEAKAVKTGPNTLHVCYCHAPTHYYWERYDKYLKRPGFGLFDPIARLGLRLLVGPMRRWDLRAAQRPDYIIANSTFTKDQIKKYYGRDSVVIYPPVDVERFKNHIKSASQRSGFITAGRQTPYKKIDLAINGAMKADVPLIVIGRGPQHRRLRKIAGRKITFLTKANDEELSKKFGEARAFIFPGFDDFGIVAVEALAAGTPVIAYKKGGALDFVQEGSTGLFFEKQTPDALAKTIDESLKKSFDSKLISQSSEKFSATRFRQEMSWFLKKVTSPKREGHQDFQT